MSPARLVEAKSLGCPVEALTTDAAGTLPAEPAEQIELELRFAEVALRAGDAVAARERFKTARSAAEDAGEHVLAWRARWGSARAAEWLGELETAVVAYEVVEAARAGVVLGQALMRLGERQDALEALTRAAESLSAAGASREAATAWSELAEALLSSGATDEAVGAFRRAAAPQR